MYLDKNLQDVVQIRGAQCTIVYNVCQQNKFECRNILVKHLQPLTMNNE